MAFATKAPGTTRFATLAVTETLRLAIVPVVKFALTALSVETFRVEMFPVRTPRVDTFAVSVLLEKALKVVTFPVSTPRVVTLPVTVLLVMTLSVVTF